MQKHQVSARTEKDIQHYRPIERGRASDQILDDLRDQILRGTVARGDKLPTERELAEYYGVSGPTIREAVRGLTAMRLVEVRHGSGAYVTADGNQLIAISLQSLMQLEKVGISDILGVLGVLNAYATELAVSRATQDDIVVLKEAMEQIANATNANQIAQGVRAFLHALATASHNPLLTALCKFLAGLQIELALEVSEGSSELWQKIAGGLSNERKSLVNAIEKRDRESARQHVSTYHDHAIKMIAGLHKGASARSSDSKLAGFLSSSIKRKPTLSGDQRHPQQNVIQQNRRRHEH